MTMNFFFRWKRVEFQIEQQTDIRTFRNQSWNGNSQTTAVLVARLGLGQRSRLGLPGQTRTPQTDGKKVLQVFHRYLTTTYVTITIRWNTFIIIRSQFNHSNISGADFFRNPLEVGLHVAVPSDVAPFDAAGRRWGIAAVGWVVYSGANEEGEADKDLHIKNALGNEHDTNKQSSTRNNRTQSHAHVDEQRYLRT